MRLGIESLSFVSTELAGQLLRRLRNITGDRAQELTLLRDEFSDPYKLAEFYIEPHLQAYNPTARDMGIAPPVPRQSAFSLLNKFFYGGKPKYRDGSQQMFLLSDAGMGKSALLLMIKLMHLAGFWPQGCHCVLFSLSIDPLQQIKAIA
ncbi:MAG: effector protein PipB, partial [Candidatus Electrothrix sp. AR3]|nr:effector protein PipB [Candidatus Electrothrix sp. AR3]